MFEPGQVVGQFRLDRTVHRGRSSVVFAATDLSTGQPVALKMLADEHATDPAMRERFVREAQYAAQLDSHPGIATVYRWGQVGDSMYFVTEFVDGVSLAELLRRQDARGPLPTVEALAMLEQVADALDFANERGVLHRDVRPDNVMVRLDGPTRAAYVVDFGITKGSEAEGHGTFGGNANYASPEQISGSPPLDRRADVYSFGCLAFEVLGGRPPYGTAPNDAARIAAHLQAPVPSLHALRRDLPEAVDDVFTKALAKDRDTRPQRCADVVRDLRAALEQGPTGDRAAASFAPPSGTAARLPAPALGRRGAATRRRWPLVLGGAVLLLALVAAGPALVARRGAVSGEVGRGVAPTATTTTTTTSTTTTTTLPPATTTTTLAPTTTTPAPTTTTIPLGAFGFPVDSEVAAATGPESTYALAVHQRAAPAAAPRSPAWYYAEWLRTSIPAPGGAVTATSSGFAVTADERVELRDFVVTDGLVTDLTECVGGRCASIGSQFVATPHCEPAAGCPSVRSRSGDVTAYQRAILLVRPPQQVLFFELVTRQGIGRAIADVAEPGAGVHHDAATRYLVAVFRDRPVPGTQDQFQILYDDATDDALEIHYG